MSRPHGLLGGLALLALAGCGAGLFTTHRQAGSDRSTRFLVLRGEAREIDRWNAIPASRDAEHGCAFWKAIEADSGGRSKRVQAYVSIRRQRACAEASRALAARREAEQERARHLAELEEAAQTELTAGECTSENRALLDAWALFIKDAMRLRFTNTGQAKVFNFVGHEIVVADDSGVPATLDSWMASELHLFAFSRLPVELDVRTATGTEATLRSPWEDQVAYRCGFDGNCVMSQAGDPDRPEESASRVVLTRGFSELRLDVRGRGCVLLMGFAGS